MWITNGRNRSPMLLVIAVALVLGAGGLAAASIPAEDGTISGCHKVNNGQLRVVEAGEACGPDEVSITWNQTGPAGPAGANGDDGTNGTDGKDGADGVSGLELVESTSERDSTDAKFQTVTCPEGKMVVGPSFNIDFGFSEVLIDEVLVINGGTAVQALATEQPGGSIQNWSLTAIALCAKVSP